MYFEFTDTYKHTRIYFGNINSIYKTKKLKEDRNCLYYVLKMTHRFIQVSVRFILIVRVLTLLNVLLK